MAALESVGTSAVWAEAIGLVNNEAGLDASIQGERPRAPPDPDNPAADARCVQLPNRTPD